MESAIARHVRVRGRVQGVFFRASTRSQARRHDVVGWVRNDRDGSVEAWLEGEPDDVEAVVSWVRSGGPSSAVVEHVDIDDESPRGLDGFEVRH